MSAVSEVLHEAADIIERQGWRRCGGTEVGTGPKCLMGAIGQAAQVATFDMSAMLPGQGLHYGVGHIERHPACLAVVEHIGEENVGGPWVFTWNDAEGRTAEDVIGMLRAAAVIEEARESQRTPVPVG